MKNLIESHRHILVMTANDMEKRIVSEKKDVHTVALGLLGLLGCEGRFATLLQIKEGVIRVEYRVLGE